MKPLRHLIILASILSASVSIALDKPAADTTTTAPKSAETPMPGVDTARQIRSMPACKATVEEHHSCYSIFRKADGNRFSIGSPAASHEVVKFLETLKTGQTYQFPDVFYKYQQKK